MAEKVRLLLFCENRRVKKPNLTRLGPSVRSKKTPEAWFMLRNYLIRFTGKNKWAGEYYLPTDERYALPISPYAETYYTEDEITEATEDDKVALAAAKATNAETEIQNRKSRFYDFIGIAIMGLVAAFMIVVILAVSGHLDVAGLLKGIKG